MSDNQNQIPLPTDVGYDRHEAKAGLIAIISGSTIVLLLVMIVGVYWLYQTAYDVVEYEQYSGVASKELQAIHDREEEQLHRYAFIDKEKGVVRIPIDRAMDLIAAEYQQDGKVSYNTTAYAAKPEPPGGAAGASAAVVPAAPAATPVVPAASK